MDGQFSQFAGLPAHRSISTQVQVHAHSACDARLANTVLYCTTVRMGWCPLMTRHSLLIILRLVNACTRQCTLVGSDETTCLSDSYRRVT
jgi:hypothetical protein